MVHQLVVKAEPEIIEMGVCGSRAQPKRLFEMRQRRFRLAGIEEGDPELKVGPRMIAVERNCLFQLDSRFGQSVLQSMKLTKSEIGLCTVWILLDRLGCEFLGPSQILVTRSARPSHNFFVQ